MSFLFNPAQYKGYDNLLCIALKVSFVVKVSQLIYVQILFKVSDASLAPELIVSTSIYLLRLCYQKYGTMPCVSTEIFPGRGKIQLGSPSEVWDRAPGALGL